jgi:cystathionine beta-lyase/cystathionine gamma-synthase
MTQSCTSASNPPLLPQRPLDLGADICMTSGTKFIGGHGDVTLGLLTVKGEALGKRVYFLQARRRHGQGMDGEGDCTSCRRGGGTGSNGMRWLG